MRFNKVRELAEERVSILMSENDMPQSKAELDAIRWAKREHGVTLIVVLDAENELPYAKLSGRVLWPIVPDREVELTAEKKLDALSIAALRAVNRHTATLPANLREAYHFAVLCRLAADEGISQAEIEEYFSAKA